MKLQKIPFKRIALLLFVVIPVLAWLIVKPVRIVAPTLVGIACDQGPVCVDDPSQRAAALQLYAEGTAFVSRTVSPLAGSPRVIFCTTEACAESFGLGARSAVTLGTFGTVIRPRAWQHHYVRHELIHILQGQRLGVLRLLFLPKWFTEGMAYSLSQDPRPTLAEPWNSYRQQFNTWFAGIDKAQLWQLAGKL